MKYFTIAEMVKSDTADRLGINNRLPRELLANTGYLIEKVLDPVREWYGKPIYVNSGYRCPELNKAVGGVPDSFHLTGCAADIDTRSRSGSPTSARTCPSPSWDGKAAGGGCTWPWCRGARGKRKCSINEELRIKN